MFNEDKKLVEQAKSLGKYESKVIEDGDKKHLLCGTPLAFDDVIEISIREFLGKMAQEFGIYKQINEMEINMDLLAEVRDKVAELILDTYDSDVVYGSIEY